MRITDLFEAPISNFELIGDWNKSHSFRNKVDRNILQNAKAVEKIKMKWENTRFRFNMYFVNMPQAGSYLETGVVAPSWLHDNLPAVAEQITVDPDAINILYTNNTGTARVPMTAWIIAHRFGHALAAGVNHSHKYLWDETIDRLHQYTAIIMNLAYGTDIPERVTANNFASVARREPMFKNFYQRIGTFKSARDGKIRNAQEFIHELIAQYLITGGIRFNSLPKSFEYGKKVFGKSAGNAKIRDAQIDIDTANGYLEDYAEILEDEIETMLGAVVGRVFVM